MRHRLPFLIIAATCTTLLFQAVDMARPAIGQATGTQREYKAKSPKLSRAEFDAILAKPEQVLILDVRRPDEITAIGGLPVFLSVQARDVEKGLAFIPKDRTIVTVSNHAGRAGAAADVLASHGFRVAGALGAQDYEAEGGSLVKIKPPTPRAAEAEKN